MEETSCPSPHFSLWAHPSFFLSEHHHLCDHYHHHRFTCFPSWPRQLHLSRPFHPSPFGETAPLPPLWSIIVIPIFSSPILLHFLSFLGCWSLLPFRFIHRLAWCVCLLASASILVTVRFIPSSSILHQPVLQAVAVSWWRSCLLF